MNKLSKFPYLELEKIRKIQQEKEQGSKYIKDMLTENDLVIMKIIWIDDYNKEEEEKGAEKVELDNTKDIYFDIDQLVETVQKMAQKIVKPTEIFIIEVD